MTTRPIDLTGSRWLPTGATSTLVSASNTLLAKTGGDQPGAWAIYAPGSLMLPTAAPWDYAAVAVPREGQTAAEAAREAAETWLTKQGKGGAT